MRASQEKSIVSDHPQASMPWEGVLSLASLWAGVGSLYDWIHPGEFEIRRDWAPEVIRARMAEAVLLFIQDRHANHLPKHADGWLELIGRQVQRATAVVDAPSAHVDWPKTVGTFGRYPCESYFERRPVYSHNTSFTRVLKWTAWSVGRAERVVRSQFGHRPLGEVTSRRFSSALNLAEVAAVAADQDDLSQFDLDACSRAGGVWLVLAKVARLLSGLWKGSAIAQLFALRPILPRFQHQVFELATLGVIAAGVREGAGETDWVSAAPLAAAATGTPSLCLRAGEGDWNAYYQTIPAEYRERSSPYRVLSSGLTGGSLRPDIWIEQAFPGCRVEIVIECKYSLDPSYVATGIVQSLAYEAEFPPQPDVRRLHVVVGPEEVVASPCCWEGRFVLATPWDAREICRNALAGDLDGLLNEWGDEAPEELNN